MNRFAVLSEGFEHLSYHFGRQDASEGHEFSERGDTFLLHRADSELSCKMALEEPGALSSHAALPVGFVSGENGVTYLVSQLSGKRVSAASLSREERREFSSAVIRRLAAIHSSGLGCGGIAPDAVEFSGGVARMTNASRLYAMEESDTTFFEVAATLRALAGKGFARKSELASLASEYLSSSPVCRVSVLLHMGKKSRGSQPHIELARTALKYSRYL